MIRIVRSGCSDGHSGGQDSPRLISWQRTNLVRDQISGPLYTNGRYQALTTILATPEVAASKKAHHIDSDGTERVPGNFLSQSKSPELIGELNDVTVSQALDYVLKTFPGYWVYEDANCENGDRAVRFKFY